MSEQNLRLILCFIVIVLLQIIDIRAGSSRNVFPVFFNPHEHKIINGTEASLNATRHQVSIRRRRQNSYFFGTGHICGGSLISENVVLSAAHCFVDYTVKPNGTFAHEKDFIVVMGNLDRFEYNNNTLVFDIIKIVKRVAIFDLSRFNDDIVLLMLSGTVPAKHATVKPIILNDGPLKNNTLCQATGWGETEDGYITDILRTVDLPVIDFEDCRKRTDYGSLIHEGMICAGYLKGEKDACYGDSGGPLVCRGLQAGIVSGGSKCAKPLRPSVNTDVAYYKNWILKEVAKHNGTLPRFAGNSNGGGNNDVGGGGEVNRNGVSSLCCSLVLVGLILIFNYLLSQMK